MPPDILNSRVRSDPTLGNRWIITKFVEPAPLLRYQLER